MRYFIIFLLFVLPGCQSWMPNNGYDPVMTVQQIRAIAADKQASVICLSIPTHLGPAKTVIVTLDQRTIDNGGIQTTPDCQIIITTTKPEKK